MKLYFFYTIFFAGEKEKRNIGLNLRSNRGKGKESVGFTKRTEGERTEWLYSEALEADLIAYGNEFPRVVDYLYTQFTESVGEGGNVDLRAEDIWEDEDECKREKERLGKFIKQLACCKVKCTISLNNFNIVNSRHQCKTVAVSD